MMLRRAVSNYQSAFPFTEMPAPSSTELLARGGISAATSFERPSTLGGIEGIWGAVRSARPRKKLRHLGPASAFAYGSALSRQLGDDDCMSGPLDTIVGAGKSAVDTFNKKTERLENALTIIIGLSGVAAITGILGVIRR